MTTLAKFNKDLVGLTNKHLPTITPGDTVKVYQKIKEGEKFRTQAFEGVVIAKKHGTEPGATITVRRVSGGIGMEKTFPLYLPTIEKIEVVKKSKVRRAKLYYLRGKSAKATRRKLKSQSQKELTPKKQKTSPSPLEDKVVKSETE